MPSQRRFGPRSRSHPRRVTTWEQGPIASDVTVQSSTGKLWTSGIFLASQTRATLVRVRGYIHVWQLTATAAGDGFIGAFGLCIVSSEAFAAGVASVPSPLEELGWDGWLWHQMWDIRSLTGTFADGVNAASVSQRIEIDSKSMRIMEDDNVLCGVSDQTESGTATAEFNANTRVLFKLP